MAGRILNRRELRKQSDEAEQIATETAVPTDPDAPASPAAKEKPKRASRAKPKVPGVPKVRKPRAKKAPPRMRARWALFDGAMKQIAVFDYNQRPAADEKLLELLAKKKGAYFMQIVKEAMPEPEPVEPVAVA